MPLALCPFMKWMRAVVFFSACWAGCGGDSTSSGDAAVNGGQDLAIPDGGSAPDGSSASPDGSSASDGGVVLKTDGGQWGGVDPDAGDLTNLGNTSAGWALNEWHEIGDNHLSSVYLTAAQENAIDPALWQVSGPDSVISIWSSGAFDGTRLFIGAAGGHGGYNGNEMYEFSLSTLKWRRLYDPSPTAQCAPNGSGTDCTTQWGPQALHQYDGLVYSSKTRSIFSFGTGPSACWVWRLDDPDVTTGWHHFDCAPNMPGSYMKTAEDPASGAIIAFGGGLTGVAALDPMTLTWSRVSPSDVTYASYSVADVDPVRRKMYFLNVHSGGPLYQMRTVSGIDLDATPYAESSGTTIPPVDVGDYSCFLYHPPSHKMLAWNGTQRIWSWDPDTDTWTEIATTGVVPTTSAMNGGGIHSKCGYVPSLGLLIGVNNADRGVWAMRPAL
jgi:hypothetical protein